MSDRVGINEVRAKEAIEKAMQLRPECDKTFDQRTEFNTLTLP